MSHPEQKEFCESVKKQFPDYFENCFVLDIGSLDINGNNKELFTNCLYLGVDILPGNNVDVISKGHELSLPSEVADFIVSTECFEHDKYYQETFKNILRLLKPGGLLMFTCATTGRPEHGTPRTTPQDSPLTSQFQDWCDYYKNLTAEDFLVIESLDDIFEKYAFLVNHRSHDLYFWGIKKGHLEVDLNKTFQMLDTVDADFFKKNKHVFSGFCKLQYLTNICNEQISKLNPDVFEKYSYSPHLENILPYLFNELKRYEELTIEHQKLLEQQQLIEEQKLLELQKLFELQNSRYGILGQYWNILFYKHLKNSEQLSHEALILQEPRIKTNLRIFIQLLREIKYWVITPKQQLKKYLKKGLFFLKTVYQKLPLNHSTRMKLRVFFANHFPKFLLFSGTEHKVISDIKATQINYELNKLNKAKLIEELLKCELASTDSPKISVIIPIYGNIDYTLKCLNSLFTHKPVTSFEVIVVDDCSPDDSYEVLKQFKNIRLFKNTKNQGFIRSCNYGALQAKGEFLYFLNNDTQVTDGWLDELYYTFANLPNTGLVGSKLIYPDEVLQEAGGIIWQDGSAWNFGRGQNHHLPEFNYAREVDYCSGASIMLPKLIFNLVGGFDEHYLPAYCEDSDLALKIRQLGYRVIYQPMSVVFHFEGVSSGTDLNHGVKSYQVNNSKKLFARWQHHLSNHQPNGIDVDKAKDRRMQFRVLVLDHCTPTPDKDAGSVTALNVMLLLREMNFQVTFIPEDNFLYMPKYTSELQKRGIEALYHPYVSSVKEHLEKMGKRYDMVLLIRPGVAGKYLSMIEKYAPQAKKLYLPMDLHFLRMMRECEIYPNAAKLKVAKEMQNLELDVFSKVDGAMVHSDIEIQELEQLNSALRLKKLPLIIDFKGKQNDFHQRKDILFIGGFQHYPNVDAMNYFVGEIMPILRTKMPGACLNIIGSHPPKEIQALACQDVIIHGFVEDVTTYFNDARVSIAPLRYGAGVKGKVGTAIAFGVPVVATSIAAEGMHLTHQQNVLIADNPEDFADAIVQLYQDEALWNQISDNGLNFAKQSWSKEAVWEILSKIIQDMGFNVEPAKHPLSMY